MKYNIILLLVFGKLFSQDVEYVGQKNSINFTFYRVSKKKCPGYISDNNCLRFLDLISIEKPKKNNFYDCNTELKYNVKPFDTIVLIANTDKLFFKIKEHYPVMYNEIKKTIPLDFDKWEMVKLIDTKKYKLYTFSYTNVKYLLFKLKVSFVNKELFEDNILLEQNNFEDFVMLKVPIE